MMGSMRISIAILCFTMSVSADSRIKETASFYSCCGNPTLRFNPKCECTWEVKKQSIAQYKVTLHGNTCHSPCKTLEDGLLTLEQCVEVKAECDCDTGKFMATEIIQHHGELCSSAAPRNFPSDVLLLPCLMIAGWLLMNRPFWLVFVVL